MTLIKAKIGLIFTLFSFFALICNFIDRLCNNKNFFSEFDIITISILIIFLTTIFIKNKISIFTQLICTSIISIFSSIFSEPGISFIFFSILFFELYVYHFFDKFRRLKIFLFSSSIIILFIIIDSIKIHEISFISIKSTGLLLVFLYILYSLTKFAIDEWLLTESDKINKYENKIKSLENAVNELSLCAIEAIKIARSLNNGK
jgi:hypothetical protein